MGWGNPGNYFARNEDKIRRIQTNRTTNRGRNILQSGHALASGWRRLQHHHRLCSFPNPPAPGRGRGTGQQQQECRQLGRGTACESGAIAGFQGSTAPLNLLPLSDAQGRFGSGQLP